MQDIYFFSYTEKNLEELYLINAYYYYIFAIKFSKGTYELIKRIIIILYWIISIINPPDMGNTVWSRGLSFQATNVTTYAVSLLKIFVKFWSRCFKNARKYWRNVSRVSVVFSEVCADDNYNVNFVMTIRRQLQRVKLLMKKARLWFRHFSVKKY